MTERTTLGFPGIRILNITVFIVLVTANFLSELIQLNGVTIGEVSTRYTNLFTPADITFSIWIVIYIMLAAFVLFPFALFGKVAIATPTIVRSVTLPFILSSFFNIAWLVAWHYDQIAVSLVVMLCLLASLAAAYRRLERLRDDMQFADKVFIRLPFRVYFGWITVATMTNIVVFMQKMEWLGGESAQQGWTVGFLVFTLLIALGVILKYKDAAYGMVILWAYMGILLRHMGSSGNGFARDYPVILLCLTICLVILFTAIQLAIHRSRHRAGKQPEAGLLK